MAVLTLASQSQTRIRLLRSAGLEIAALPARLDEAAIRDSLVAEGATPRDIADALAEHKALRVLPRAQTRLVLGCDQLLECEGNLFEKPADRADARRQLLALRGKTHRLHTAAVLYADAQLVWRHVAVPRLTMRQFSDAWLEDYLDRTWPDIAQCVGAYQIEGAGVGLFSEVEGDFFSIQGLPLLPLLNTLLQRGDLPQ